MMWFAIGSNVALRSAGLTVMRAAGRIGGKPHDTVHTTTDGGVPLEMFSVNWVGKQIEVVRILSRHSLLIFVMAMSHAELPALVQ
jgi:hypothetical protein